MILSIETSTPTCSVAIHNEGNLIASYELHLEKSHSGSLTPMIEEVLMQGGIKRNEIKAVALSKGPGSYTGLRIGTATAKGLCFSLDIPLISVSTLRSMALEVAGYQIDQKLLLVPMLDARRMEVYTAIFDNTLNQKLDVNAKIIDKNSFSEYASKHQLILFGNGAEKCKEILNDQNFYYVDQVVPSAKYIGKLAWDKFKNAEFEDLAYFEPFYLKDFMVKKPTKNKALI